MQTLDIFEKRQGKNSTQAKKTTKTEAMKLNHGNLTKLIELCLNNQFLSLFYAEPRSDFQVVNHGSLLTDFSPPVNPPAEIDDPNDKKPSDWDEREKVQDPEATKPEDWDENAPKQLPDRSASKPDGKAIV